MEPWSFLHICDMQPGSPRSFRFNQRNMDNWQTACPLSSADIFTAAVRPRLLRVFLFTAARV